MARSGQFGQVGEDKDGDSNNTVFIEYAWYPWHLPADTDPWDDDHFYLDRTQGKNTTYALYHKNFFIKNNGDVFFNGKLFTESGRIGDWVITKTKLKSVSGTVEVGPSQIKLGVFTAYATGKLEGPTWWINENGQASFEGSGNVFHAGQIIMDNNNGILRIPTGSRLYIGDGKGTYLYADGTNGVFNGPKFRFSDRVDIENTLQFGAAYGDYGAMSLNKDSGLQMTYQGQNYYFSLGGNIRCHTLEFQPSGSVNFNNSTITNMTLDSSNITVNGSSLETYIRNLISNMCYTKSQMQIYTVQDTGGTNRNVYGQL